MLIGLSLHLVEGEDELVVQRLLDPQRAVIVERGDALGRRYKVESTLLGHPRDEIDYRLLNGAVVPRRQGIGLRLCRRTSLPSEQDRADKNNCQTGHVSMGTSQLGHCASVGRSRPRQCA
jgi:hypothetical protein